MRLPPEAGAGLVICTMMPLATRPAGSAPHPVGAALYAGRPDRPPGLVVTKEPTVSQSRLVVLVSGTGSILQALLDACASEDFGARVVAVGADRDNTGGTAKADAAGIPTFVRRLPDFPDRASWDRALTQECTRHDPDLIIAAGFLKLVGPDFLARFGGRLINTHPALLPSFPGLHSVRDALAHGVKVTGCSVILADAGVDSGPILAQQSVPVLDDDDEESLHERIKVAERSLVVATIGKMVRDGWSVQDRTVRIGN
jgi:formyltetrahydrofolate-dependent phosphoribosylglycinamide formyltransferase